jgi:hypothetical protein
MRLSTRIVVAAIGSTALVAASVVTPLATSSARAATLPLQGEAQAFLNSTYFWNFGASPLGANVPCTPSAAHPRHG